MEAGVTYTVYSKCDDGACVFFGGENGTKVASPGAESGYNKTMCESYTPETTGWVDFYAYTWDWNGGKGPVGDNLWGLAYNTNGVVCTDRLTKGTEPWMVFQDSGNCETLYYELPESWLMVAGTDETESGFSVTLSVTLPEDATDCEALLLYDEADRGDHRISDWANSAVKAIPGGTQTVTFEIPKPEDGSVPVVCAVVKGKEANGVDFIEYANAFALQNKPTIDLSVSSVLYADAAFQVELSSLGSGAATASIELNLYSDAELTGLWRTVAVAEGLDSAKTIPFQLDGLMANTTYWVTVKAVNNHNHEALSEAVSFTTLTPKPGSFQSCNMVSRRLNTMDCQIRLQDYGDGSSSADVTLEVSKTSDFADAIAFPGSSVSGELPQDLLVTAENLEPGTDYWARAKAVNSWGLVAYSDSFAFTTRPQPFIPSAISSVATDGGANISMTLSDILDGATGTVTLKVDGQIVQTWTIEEGVNSLSCPAFVAIENGAQRTITYSVDCAFGGTSYPAVVEVVLAAGQNLYIAGALADCKNFFPIAGETVTLPEIQNGNLSYFVANETVGELQSDGRTVKLLKAGGTAIVLHEFDPVGATNIIVSSVPLVVPPVPAGEGKVFLWTEKNYLWRDPANWICLNDASSTGGGYPHNVDDVAMIFERNGKFNNQHFSFGSDESEIVLGEVYKGSLNAYNIREGEIVLARIDNGPATNVMRFAKSDGSIPGIYFCTSRILDQDQWLTIGRGTDSTWKDARLRLELPQGLVVDGGFGNAASNQVRRIFLKFGNVDIVLAEGTELRLTNMNDKGVTMNSTTVPFTSGCTISGGGRIVHETVTYSGMWADLNNFDGTYVEATYHPKNGFDRVYGTFLWSTNVANATLEVAGWVDESLFAKVGNNNGPDANLFRGYAGRGNTHGFASTSTNPGNVLGYKNVVLKGGLLSLKAESNANWVDKLVVNHPAEMTVERGASVIYFYEQSNVNNPTNALTVPKLTQNNGAILYLNENNSKSYGKTPEEVRQHIRFNDFAEHAIGESGDPTSADSGEIFPIIPWLLTKGNWCTNPSLVDGNGQSTWFVSVNGENEVVSPYRTQTALADVTLGQNVSCWSKSFALTEDKTINSLYKGGTAAGNNDMGEGRTLTVTSGGVILSRYGSIGSEATCGGAAGRLNFPNRAYITMVFKEGGDTKRGIWAPMTSPNGCSFSNLTTMDTYLGGDQTGIDGDLTVNYGSVVLGTVATPAKLDCTVNLVGKKAKLTVVSAENFNPKTSVLNFVDIMDENAVVQLDSDATVYMLQVDGVPLLRGQYSAANLPSRLSGSGVLTVRKDGQRDGLMLRLR